jgi:hypothetical protein
LVNKSAETQIVDCAVAIPQRSNRALLQSRL